MLQLAFIIVLLLCFEFVQGQEDDLDSYCTKVTRNGRRICRFMSIPYAIPPVGPYRFDNPVPLGWNGDFRKTDSNQCPQFNDAGVLVGDEDCLYLNVYEPEEFLYQNRKFPVMVYFHGGNFVKGSGRSIDAGPEYLLDRDIVLVTVNYRLGVLGFLSTGDAAAPGNFGLKDQVVALKWIQQNIDGFKGNPRRVTIFGDDAGGISTSLHAMSSASNGLFHQYISQSGNIFPPASTHRIQTYKNLAVTLANYFNCSTTDTRWIVFCLRYIDAYTLLDSNDIFKTEFWTINTWGPTQEPNLPGAFLTIDRDYAISQNAEVMKPLPAILGNVANEGLKYTVDLITNDTQYHIVRNRTFNLLEYLATNFIDDEFGANEAYLLEDNFFIDIDPNDKETYIKTLTDLITNIGFVLSTQYQMNNILEKHPRAPFYFYSFDYRGTLSHTSLKTGDNKDIGVTQGDDLIYLFPPSPELKNGSSSLQLSESDEIMIDIMIDLWTSFAVTGTPTSSHTSDPNVWKLYNPQKIEYLQIGNDRKPTLATDYRVDYNMTLALKHIRKDLFYFAFQANE